MKQADVKIGEVYQTYIGQDLCLVEVVCVIPGGDRWLCRQKTTFVVKRVGASAPLPKRRTAAALRPV